MECRLRKERGRGREREREREGEGERGREREREGACHVVEVCRHTLTFLVMKRGYSFSVSSCVISSLSTTSSTFTHTSVMAASNLDL